MQPDYRTSHLAPEKGQLYQASFEANRYRSMVWELEKQILDDIVERYFQGKKIDHLDFACGTGRIFLHLENRTYSTTAIDISASMLEVARKQSSKAEIHEADLTMHDMLGSRKFNLITAFRFFPNAEPPLRNEVMDVLAKHLHEDGYFVFNNHKHTGSTRNRLARLCGRRNYEGMSLAEVRELVTSKGLEIVRTYSLCIFPASEKRMLLPRSWLLLLESALSKCYSVRQLGENLIFVCVPAKVRAK